MPTAVTPKINALKLHTSAFIGAVHLDGLHWGSVNSFNDSTNIRAMENEAEELIDQVGSLYPDGKTALYDAIIESIETLDQRQSDADREKVPKMVLVFTDGKDNQSSHSISDVRNTIDNYDFFPDNNCYFAIGGIGHSQKDELGSADESTLRDICNDNYGMYTHTQDIAPIFALFFHVVTIIGEEIGVDIEVTETPDEKRAKVEAFKTEFGAVFPIDYSLVLDTSGSMKHRTLLTLPEKEE